MRVQPGHAVSVQGVRPYHFHSFPSVWRMKSEFSEAAISCVRGSVSISAQPGHAVAVHGVRPSHAHSFPSTWRCTTEIKHSDDRFGHGFVPSWIIWRMSQRIVEIAALSQLVIPVTHVHKGGSGISTRPEYWQVD